MGHRMAAVQGTRSAKLQDNLAVVGSQASEGRSKRQHWGMSFRGGSCKTCGDMDVASEGERLKTDQLALQHTLAYIQIQDSRSPFVLHTGRYFARCGVDRPSVRPRLYSD